MSGGTATTTSFRRGEDPLRADKLNLAFSERIARSGDTMAGFLTLFADPVQPFDAVTKQYVDRISVGSGFFLPLSGGTLSGDLFVGNNTASHRVFLNGPANDAGRELIWDSAGVQRWSIGPDGTAEGGTVTVVTAGAIAAGTSVLPVVTTAGVTSGMQISATGMPKTTYVVSAVGTVTAGTTASASVDVGNRVIPVANTAGFIVGMSITNPGIPVPALIKSVGGTSGVVTTTATSTIYPSFLGQTMTVSDITNVFPGMLAAGAGIAPDASVLSTAVADSGLFAVALSKDFTDNVIKGQTVTFSAAVVLSTPTTGIIASGSTVSAGPAIVASQNTTAAITSGTPLILYANTGNSLHLNTAANDGGNWLIPLTINRSTGVVNFSEGLSINTPNIQQPNSLTTFQPILLTTSTWSGSPSPANLFYRFHQFTMADNVDAGNLGVTGFHIIHTYGGNRTSGGRVGQAIQLYQAQGFTTPGGSGSRYNNIRTGLNIAVRAGENAGGTAPTIGGAAGAVFSLATYAYLIGPGVGGYVTGAQNFFELCGYNINISAGVGSSVAVKHALTIDPLSTDKVQGSAQDACIQMAMQPGAIGWKNQIAMGNKQGSWPLDPTSNIWGTYRGAAPRAMQANYGLNWLDVAFTTAPIAVPGFVVDGGGNLSSGALAINTTGNTTTIDAKLIHVTNSVVFQPLASSGAWTPGMGLYDASGNQWLCTTTDASGLDGISGHLTGVSPVPVGPAFIVWPPPNNPVSVTDQSGHQTATLTLTWSALPALSIQPSGGTTTFGGPVTLPSGSTLAGYLPLTGGTVTGGTNFNIVPGTALVMITGNPAAIPVVTGVSMQITGADGNSARLQFDGYAGQGEIKFRRTDGSAAAPIRVNAGGLLGLINYQGYDGVAMSGVRASMNVSSDGASAWSTTSHPTKFTWATTPNNSITQSVVMTLSGSGNLLIGTITDGVFKLDVNGDARVANITATGSIIVATGGPTITSGSAVPSSTQPKGSLYTRTAGGVGTTLYVSQGAGTWNAVAGV